MRFNNRRYITRGVSDNVDLLLQLFMWQCIDELEGLKDYLQVFKGLYNVYWGNQSIELYKKE